SSALPNIPISLFNWSHPFFEESTVTDEQGGFDFEVFAGNWALWAYSYDPRQFDLVPAISVRVEDGVDQSGITLIALTPTTEITGSLRDVSGMTLSGYSVTGFLSQD